jgi:hypothetical protein
MWGLDMIEVAYIRAKGQVRRDLQTVGKLSKQATTDDEARQARQAFFNQWRICKRLAVFCQDLHELKPGNGVR